MHQTGATAPLRREPARTPVVRRTFWVGAAIAVVCAAGLAVQKFVLSDDGSSQSNRTTAVAVSVEGLRTLAGALDRPIYWAGPSPGGVTYELTQAPDNRVYLRYLPQGVDVGVAEPYLTIGTYPVANAFATTSAAASQKGSVKIKVGGGGVAFYSTRVPQSVYLAFPNSDYQVEVYDPSSGLAHQLVASGKIGAVKGSGGAAKPSVSAVAVSEKGLKTLAGALGQPLFWAGPQESSTYELTQTPGGRIYIRYLPDGVEVGANRPYLTVGTYPVRDAYATTLSASRQNGAVTIDVEGGGVAFYNTRAPQSVYLAYPKSDYQVEIYDPSSQRAHELVKSGRISAVG